MTTTYINDQGRVVPGSDIQEVAQRLVDALRVISKNRPKEKAEWGALSDCGNSGDVESNGYDVCAWRAADEADAALSGLTVTGA